MLPKGEATSDGSDAGRDVDVHALDNRFDARTHRRAIERSCSGGPGFASMLG
ncbi:MAG: hypothetical protein AVDCRST_MAG87-756 [uncultured Thermomicrobiales bacterium]|uniref:Uncharacterized protein n=1 Tax=uncultured Thermomicrobiales bacterium TaxID=1645740 RepID=A0A6J4UJQ6_9BACT|nr:MAG: hypothetical protein AVDCRST_MAG87-756 [uncultured Thermomicrobiales bacterium]